MPGWACARRPAADRSPASRRRPSQSVESGVSCACPCAFGRGFTHRAETLEVRYRGAWNFSARKSQGRDIKRAKKLAEEAGAVGMSQIVKDSGLGRESRYKALRSDSNLEFATVLRVIHAPGARLTAEMASNAATGSVAQHANG
ncbi:MAG TPA: hypothetical protein VH023_18845 [Rhodopila sp.]|nr:hypothetical protein [Rhodopila sp.]